MSYATTASFTRVCVVQGGADGGSSYVGRVSDYDTLLRWATDKCVPLVREITFSNAEVPTDSPALLLCSPTVHFSTPPHNLTPNELQERPPGASRMQRPDPAKLWAPLGAYSAPPGHVAGGEGADCLSP